MSHSVDTSDPAAVESEVLVAYKEMFPSTNPEHVSCAFAQLVECFEGRNPQFQPIDVGYHNIEHTLQGTLCLVRLLRARDRAGAEPRLTRRAFELSLMAILMHDTGYLKRRGDTVGTGAKYTATHVARSAEFARECLQNRGFAFFEILAVQNMIRCTGVGVDLAAIRFQSELERLLGCAVGTADLLGQMAADDYVEKLPILYAEFAEAATYADGRNPAVTTFRDAEELVRKTPEFWQSYVWPRLNQDFRGLYHFLEDPYPGGRNWYLEQIDANLERIRRQYP